jgi:hypothetical protein
MACGGGSNKQKTVGFPVRKRAIEGDLRSIAARRECGDISAGPDLWRSNSRARQVSKRQLDRSGSGNNATRLSSNSRSYARHAALIVSGLPFIAATSSQTLTSGKLNEVIYLFVRKSKRPAGRSNNRLIEIRPPVGPL